MAKSTKTKETADAVDPAGAATRAGMAAFSPVAATAWMEIMQESMRFMNARLQEDMEVQRAMLACTTPQELMKVQTDFCRKAMADYTEETQRMMRKMGLAVEVTAEKAKPKPGRDLDDVPV
ncbi:MULTISPECIES: phasin family protein [unclassified Roseovarius]|uniref:phasin family protein n=1 Tax=unclassified Roseovarius TaxID=2614913 RepID=UPI00273EFB26|nr:phasin family protein [Roseovarius sp. MMSF_3350]